MCLEQVQHQYKVITKLQVRKIFRKAKQICSAMKELQDLLVTPPPPLPPEPGGRGQWLIHFLNGLDLQGRDEEAGLKVECGQREHISTIVFLAWWLLILVGYWSIPGFKSFDIACFDSESTFYIAIFVNYDRPYALHLFIILY